jgi:hypothetical protein
MDSTGRWPYLTIYYKAGEFSHLRLYARKDPNHETWGNISVGVNIDEQFENIDTVSIDF